MSVVLKSPEAAVRPPVALTGGATGVRALTPSQTTIRCGRCAGSRPVGHAHCYTCGAKLTGRAVTGRRMPAVSWGAVRAWSGWTGVRRALTPRSRSRLSGEFGLVERRTFGDRVARWYAGASVVGAVAWLVWGGAIAAPSAALATPSEACAWVDAQRVQLTGEAAKVVEAQRGGVAQRLGELAALVGSGAHAR